MPQTVWDQSHAHTTQGPVLASYSSYTNTHTHTLKVADGCTLHTGRTAGTLLEKREGPLLPVKTKTKIWSSQNGEKSGALQPCRPNVHLFGH